MKTKLKIFKIYKKKFSQTPMLKFQAEITGMLVFLTEITEVPAGCVHA